MSLFFIDGSSEARIRADIIRNVRSLGIEHSQKLLGDCLIYLAQPSQHLPRLLVYDNVDDPELDIASLLPPGDNAVVIITSRNHSIGEMCPDAHLKLDVMSAEEAVELLLRGTCHARPLTEQAHQAMVSIAELLGRHPIALSQACSYMYQTMCSPTAYLEKLQKNPIEILAKRALYRRDVRYPSAFAAFEASFEMVPALEQNCLRLLSCFHWDKFPLELVNLAAEYHFSSYEYQCMRAGEGFEAARDMLKDIFHRDGQWNNIYLDETTASLQNYSLVTLSPGNDTTLLQMHPLFHGWVQCSIQEKDRPKFRSAAALLLALGARKKPTCSGQYLASHVNHLLSQWVPSDPNDRWAFGYILSDADQYEAALKLREGVVGELKSHLNEHDAVLHASLEVLANTYSKLNRFEDAEKLQEVLLKLRKTAFGERSEGTILSYDTLATTYRKLGRFKEAEEKQVEVLRLRTDMLGRDHPDTVLASSDLAGTYRDLGRLDEAETLLVEVCKIRTKLLGKDHPDTIIAVSNLALTYFVLRRLDDAEELQLEVLSLREKALGVYHPDTIVAASNLALTYRDLGRLQEARELQEMVLSSAKKIFGEGHPNTLSAYRELAYTYYSMGRISDAEGLQADGLKLAGEIFGEDHRNTISAMQELLPIQIKVLESKKQALGETHPDTILAYTNLALTHEKLGDLDRAEELCIVVVKLERKLQGATDGDRHPSTLSAIQRLVPIQIELFKSRKQLFGEHHEKTLLASSNLATTYRSLGQLTAAEALQVEVVKLRKLQLGPEHLDTILASSNLALTYRDIGRHDDAESIQREVLSVRVKLLGEDHLDTILASSNLAFTCLLLGKINSAMRHQEGVHIFLQRVLGEDHPEAIVASSNLALTYRNMGRLEDARKQQVQVLMALKKTVGEHHPDTVAATRNLVVTYCSMEMFREAEDLQTEIVAIKTESLGERHPETVSAMNNLASIQVKLHNWLKRRYNASLVPPPFSLAISCYQLGRLDEALELMLEVLEYRTEFLGIAHADTISTYSWLSSIYRMMDRHPKAEEMEAELRLKSYAHNPDAQSRDQYHVEGGTDPPGTIWGVAGIEELEGGSLLAPSETTAFSISLDSAQSLERTVSASESQSPVYRGYLSDSD
jgi:tetratricopeptide (TPR) repeat protein